MPPLPPSFARAFLAGPQAADAQQFAQAFALALIDRLWRIAAVIWNFLATLPGRVAPQIFTPAFIGVFLLFTLLMWIGMSDDYRGSTLASLGKAALMAFCSVAVLFALFNP